MIPHHVDYQLAILGLLWLWVMLHYAWPSRCAPSHPRPSQTRAHHVQAHTLQRAQTLRGSDVQVPLCRLSAIPAEPSSPMITVLAALAFRKHRCENTPLT
jgi:hypothetical protein